MYSASFMREKEIYWRWLEMGLWVKKERCELKKSSGMPLTVLKVWLKDNEMSDQETYQKKSARRHIIYISIMKVMNLTR